MADCRIITFESADIVLSKHDDVTGLIAADGALPVRSASTDKFRYDMASTVIENTFQDDGAPGILIAAENA